MIYMIDENGFYFGAEINLNGLQEVPQRPDDDHEWDTVAQTWKPRPLSLDEVKAREVLEIIRAADARLENTDNATRRAVVKLAQGGAVPALLLAKIKKADDIEDARDAAILAVNAATTKTAAKAVKPAIVWP